MQNFPFVNILPAEEDRERPKKESEWVEVVVQCPSYSLFPIPVALKFDGERKRRNDIH